MSDALPRRFANFVVERLNLLSICFDDFSLQICHLEEEQEEVRLPLPAAALFLSRPSSKPVIIRIPINLHRCKVSHYSEFRTYVGGLRVGRIMN